MTEQNVSTPKEKIIPQVTPTPEIPSTPPSPAVVGVVTAAVQNTKQEADAIAKALKKGVGNYQDKKAIEEVLFAANSPRILHIATHGYFLKKEETKPDDKGLATEMDKLPDLKIENPMLRSGIVLAGVNA